MELDMTKGSPSKLITKFIIPIIIGNIFQQLYSMVDTIIVGRFVGVDALAAVGASYPITMIFMAIAVGSNIGCSVVISQLFGAKEYEKKYRKRSHPVGDRDNRDDGSQYGRHGQSASGDEYSGRYF